VQPKNIGRLEVTNYAGSLNFVVSGRAVSVGLVNASVPLGVTLSSVFLNSNGSISGSGRASGNISATIHYYNGPSYTESYFIDTGNLPLMTSLSMFNIPLGSVGQEFGINLTQFNSFNATRSEIVVSASGTFDTVSQGYHLIGTATASGTLRATTAILSIAALDATLAEGQSGTRPFTFQVTRIGNTSTTTSAPWTITGAGVNAADFLNASGTVTFLPGETTKTLTISVLGDGVVEADETFVLSLPTLAPGELMIATTSATGTILDDDSPIHQTVFATMENDVFSLGDGIDTVVFTGSRGDYRIGIAGNVIRVQSAGGGYDDLKDVEQLQFGASTPITVKSLLGLPGTDDLMSFITNGRLSFELPIAYTDGLLDLAYVYPGTNSDDVVAGTGRNDFMNLAGGNDAVHMGDGDDIVDGGGGSNFLSGDAGRDTFFLDGRFGVPVWSAITDWSPGEALTLWGWTPGVSKAAWSENDGLPGYTGATMFGDLDGNGLVETAVTWTGVSLANQPASKEMQVSGIGVLYFR